MKSYQLLQTVTPRGTRYFRDGRRVDADAYWLTKFWARLECFQTVRRGDTTRNYVCAVKLTDHALFEA